MNTLVLLNSINVALLIEIPLLILINIFIAFSRLNPLKRKSGFSRRIAAMFIFFLFLTIILAILLTSYSSQKVSANEVSTTAKVEENLDKSLAIVYGIMDNPDLAAIMNKQELENLRLELEDAKNRIHVKRTQPIYINPNSGY